MKQFGKIALGALMLVGTATIASAPAQAQVSVGIGVGGGYYGGPYVRRVYRSAYAYYPRPYYRARYYGW